MTSRSIALTKAKMAANMAASMDEILQKLIVTVIRAHNTNYCAHFVNAQWQVIYKNLGSLPTCNPR